MLDEEVLIGHRDRFLGLPMSKIGVPLPATTLEHRSEDDIGSERTLRGRVIFGYVRGLDGIVSRQADHPAPCWIEIDRLPIRIGNADEVRRVLEKGHKDLTLILGAPAFSDVADES